MGKASNGTREHRNACRGTLYTITGELAHSSGALARPEVQAQVTRNLKLIVWDGGDVRQASLARRFMTVAQEVVLAVALDQALSERANPSWLLRSGPGYRG